MGIREYDEELRMSPLPERPRPIGMPYITRRLVVGYVRPVTDPLLLEVITNSHLVEPFHIFLKDVLESRRPLELDIGEIESMARSLGLGGSLDDITASQIWLWLKQIIDQVNQYRLNLLYHSVKVEWLRRYRQVYLDVNLYADKLVYVLHGYYPYRDSDGEDTREFH